MKNPLNVSAEWIEGVVGTPGRMYAMFFFLVSGSGMLIYVTETSGWHSAIFLMFVFALLQLSLLSGLRLLHLQIKMVEAHS